MKGYVMRLKLQENLGNEESAILRTGRSMVRRKCGVQVKDG